MGIDWWALVQVSVVTIVGAMAIVSLMSLANWLLVPPDGASQAVGWRRFSGYGVIGLMGLIVAFGIYLLVPYFH
ncbi:MAG: hypothetical protein LBJ44_07845 [Propionibacteriaceae bacterium]|jgi:hypothetical protein|nr:hypothetical protein [Propionibacteriaceae bacterium]